jgi:replication fork clamp-binding protein CrfC
MFDGLICNKGTRPSLFVPDSAFEILAKKQIEALREPAIQCAEVVYNELIKTIDTIDSQVAFIIIIIIISLLFFLLF